MSRSLVLLLLGCHGRAPETYADFYESFQDQGCSVAAAGACAAAEYHLDCTWRAPAPDCADYDPVAAKQCLAELPTCDGRWLTSAAVCDEVCPGVTLASLGTLQVPLCADMIACDRAMAASRGIDSAFPLGQDDPVYGVRGECFEDTVNQCSLLCDVALGEMIDLASALARAGMLPEVPPECAFR